MHELSIAQALVEIATRQARGRRVLKVEVRVGHLRQVVPSALEFAFELAAHDTAVEGAELELSVVAGEGRCRDCGAETAIAGFPLACAVCAGLDMEVIAGEELLVEALEVDSTSRPDPSGDEELATIGGTG